MPLASPTQLQTRRPHERMDDGSNGFSPESPFPHSLVLTPVSRWPTELSEATVQAIMEIPPFAAKAGLMDGQSPSASIVIVTHNREVFTRACIASLLANTEGPGYEVIVIDNGSTDGTRDYLNAVSAINPHVRAEFSEVNLGFAPANNRGIALARGERLVLLNNDTLVPPGWLSTLTSKLDDPDIGLIGPVTNRTCNEAQIETTYSTYGEFLRFAREMGCGSSAAHDVSMLAMYCVAMRRETFARVGPLDERFEVGMFEDDDYALRVKEAGYRVAYTEDVFIHHFGQASLGSLQSDDKYGTIFHANRRRFEKKWGRPWQPHRRRTSEGYRETVARIRDVVRETLPDDARVIVASKGDDDLLDLDGRTARHFPHDGDGAYLGHHPADGRAAIEALEAARSRGAEYFLLPQPVFWWLDFYAELRDHFEVHYRLVCRQEEACAIYDIRDRSLFRSLG